ncbi:MAG: DNA-binding response regulator [Chloroflexi bacterium CFX4]|nr:DNA-binding response regulator [Chloroflexi bacterium CFX4]MDL1923253.1 response regulator transcription factor [Chloroflexi bacterium CFX3]
METRPIILIVDDDEAIRSALAALLGRAGFQPILAADGAAALAAARAQTPDLALLDVVLDEAQPTAIGGLDVLRALRTFERFIPVIMLTSYAEWQVESLGQGAIAFVTKPFDANALIGQIRATLNAVAHIRREAQQQSQATSTLIHVRDLVIDPLHLRVTQRGTEIDLTPLEFALLTFLARHPNREWTREQLLDQVWGYEWAGYPRTVDRHIAALRRKLHLERDDLIETVHGSGYRLVV